MPSLHKEPLLYFILLGALIFLFFQIFSSNKITNIENNTIVVSEERINVLVSNFERIKLRAPTPNEIDGLIQQFIREEILYREALAMNLDINDSIVRRRMQQKMQFISEDLANTDSPSDKELQTYYSNNKEKYRSSAQFSFEQVFLNTDTRGQNIDSDVNSLLKKLRTNTIDSADIGDSNILRREFVDASEYEIERILGKEFLLALLDTETNAWQGPISSGYGIHLVYIHNRVDGKFPQLREVRNEVKRDWSLLMRKQANEDFYNALRERYQIIIANKDSDNSFTRENTSLIVNQ